MKWILNLPEGSSPPNPVTFRTPTEAVEKPARLEVSGLARLLLSLAFIVLPCIDAGAGRRDPGTLAGLRWSRPSAISNESWETAYARRQINAAGPRSPSPFMS
jgi:hypothetical protein